MDDDAELRDEDLPEELRRSRKASPLDLGGDGGHDHKNGEEEPPEAGEPSTAWEWRPPASAASHEAKLRALLRDLCSPEAQIHSAASRELVALLRGESGGDVLLEYVRASPRCSELADAWKFRQGKPGMIHVLHLVAAVLAHPLGRSRTGGICRNIDSFARLIVESKLEDLYVELKSEEGRRQAAALSLLAAVVRRGAGLASEVAKSFDFKLPVLQKLAGVQKRKGGREAKHRARRSTRRAFVDFAVSFLEVGNPRLLRWILQQKEMYSGVLRGLGGDDLETVVYVLGALRDRVLCAESLVPPGLRSVLFGSATLEQLSYVSGNPDGGEAAEVAHEVLVMVCTDPCNGLMPGADLKGNVKRLSDLMKKLKATESRKHRDLLLATVKGRPFLCSPYMDEFPYNLEPRASSLWYSAISLSADLISAVNFCPSFGFLTASKSGDPPSLDSVEVQCILKCIVPRSFSRSVINKGLLHSDVVVKHGSLRLLLEALRLVDSLNNVIEGLLDNMHAKQKSAVVSGQTGLKNFNVFGDSCDCHEGENVSISSTSDAYLQKWVSLKEDIQDEVRSVLPDPQVLLKLLTSFACKNSETSRFSLKRCINSPQTIRKKVKSDAVSTEGEVDIVLSVIDSELTSNMPEDYNKSRHADGMDTEKQQRVAVAEIWGPELESVISEVEDMATFFHAKLLDVLKFYLRTLPLTLEGSFDFIKILPSNPALLSAHQQQAILSLLIEYIGQAPGRKASKRVPDMMYKSLQPLISLLIFSPDQTIKNQASTLARAAMLSTGAFDYNLSEIDAWFLFLPGYDKDKHSKELPIIETFRDLSTIVVSFLCDAVSTVGNNLYKYLDQIRVLASKLDMHEDFCPYFSPLVICILQKCIRVLESDSGTFKLHERTMISLYVCNTLSFILQSQVDMKILPSLVSFILNEKLGESCSTDGDNCRRSLCEWRPLNDLLLLAESIFHQQACDPFFSLTGRTSERNVGSFFTVVCQLREFLEHDHGHNLAAVATAMCFSMICATPDDLSENFPMLLTIVQHVPIVHIRFMSSILLLQRGFLGNIANRWPDMFFCSLDEVASHINNNLKGIDAYQSSRASCSPGRGVLMHTSDLDSVQSLAAAFSLILEHAPFYALFYGIMNSCSGGLFRSNKTLDVLCAKLKEESTGNCILSLRVVLFWAYQIRSCYITQQSGDLEQMFVFCLDLIDHILDKILVRPFCVNTLKGIDASIITDCILKVVDIIFHHPIVSSSISHPLCCDGRPSEEFVGDNLEAFLESSKQYIHLMDYRILHLITRLSELMLPVGNGSNFVPNLSGTLPESILKAFFNLTQQSVSLFKEKFGLYIVTKDVGSLFPVFYILCSLLRFISPFELLEIVDWMFCKIDEDLAHSVSKRTSAFSVFFYVTNIALGMLYNYFHQTDMKASLLVWESRNRAFSVSILKNVYCKIVDFAILFKFDSADLCLQKAVNAIYSKKITQSASALKLNMQLCRIIMNSPMKLITHCIYETNKMKARTLFELIEVSPVHLSLFGMFFLGLIKELSSTDISNMDCAWSPKVDIAGSYTLDFSDDDLVLLLPAALSYFTYVFCKFRNQDRKLFGCIPSFYSRIILKGFSNWKSYCSRNIFHEDFDKCKPRSVEEFLDCFSSTLLGKTIHMLRFNSILSGGSMKKKLRLNIFDSIFDCASPYDQLFDCDVGEISPHLYKKSFNLINRAVAKISFAKLLLFPPSKLTQSSTVNVDEGFRESSKKTSSAENHAKLRLLNILFDSLDNLVRRFPWNPDQCNNADYTYLFRLLEIHILRNAVQLSIDIKSYLTQLPSIAFLKPFIRSSLLHRFEDPTTLRATRIILCTLETKSSSLDILELLLGHSEFVATILWNDHKSDMCNSIETGTLLQPLPSIFKLLNFLSPIQETLASKVTENASFESIEKKYNLQNRKLELVKLLRVLFHLRDQQRNVCLENVDVVNYSELLSLLLSGYGATLSEIDLETLHLMHEIEFIEGPSQKNIAAMDYLWGNSAIKLRQEQSFDQLVSPSKITDFETEDEQRRRLIRENIPLDSKRCLMTALHFCYDRSKLTEQMFLKNLVRDNVMNTPERTSSLEANEIQPYDPVFVLPFSIHSLLKEYLEPMEFVRLGLLAIALASISSPDEETRKLGYEVLGKFKMTLENHWNKKDVVQLRLLLAHLQNGITETWQKIPSMTAMFAAEASFILLDPSHSNFQMISKFLLHSSKVDLKVVPLFHTLFASDSIHFKANRLWILQLLYVGLNFDDDARIFMRNLLYELLLSFYMSSMSDPGTKVLILQIVKKSVKLHMVAFRLVKYHGLLSWLHSVISFNSARLYGDQADFSLKQVESALEVINNVVSLRAVTEWLKDDAFEQLSELAQFLYGLFVGSLRLLKENLSLITLILGVIISTLRISQKRRIFQPHFTFSIEALLQLCQTIDRELKDTRFHPAVQLGLTTVLMCTPPPVQSLMDKVRLSNLATWATYSALQSDPTQNYLFHKSYPDFINVMDEQQREEPLFSKLLRWITASVILGSISDKYNERNASVSLEEIKAVNLQFLLGKVARKDLENEECYCHSDENLAAIILNLQYLLGMEYAASPSTVSALCLLLFGVNNQTVIKSLDEGQRNLVVSLCEKICCPCEVNPSWRWSFYQPWRDVSLEQTDLQKKEEQYSCQILLFLFSNFLGIKLDFQVQLYQDVERSGLFAWERSLLLGDR